MVFTLPKQIPATGAWPGNRSQVDVFIACHVDMLPNLCTADVLNSLHYMGGLGEFLAQELFQASVGNDLMAADTDGAQHGPQACPGTDWGPDQEEPSSQQACSRSAKTRSSHGSAIHSAGTE